MFPVIDASFVLRFLSLSSNVQSDLSRSIGTSRNIIIEELRRCNGLSWCF